MQAGPPCGCAGPDCGRGADCRTVYFNIAEMAGTAEAFPLSYIGELKRTRKTKPQAAPQGEQPAEHRPKAGERSPTWHRDTAKREESLLRFDLEQGGATGRISDHVREGDPGDQALGVVQGASGAADRQEPAGADERPERIDSPGGAAAGAHALPLHRKVRAEWREAAPAGGAEELARYRALVQEAAPMAKPLQRTIRLTLEQRRTAHRSGLPAGRLGRKLHQAAWEPLPRLFEKKRDPDRRTGCGHRVADRLLGFDVRQDGAGEAGGYAFS
ncbi:hypothetical protein LJK87_09110 [Paenibacillus sp. P25]|nr:hypothetical protein LJK87_09110 [Paenibacillus sp. P25]